MTAEPDRIATAPDRSRVRLEGTLTRVTLRPRGQVLALEAVLDDGTGTLDLIWLGRRTIAGIGAGSAMAVEGRIGWHGERRAIYNPRYELRA